MTRLSVPLSALEIFAEAGQTCSFRVAAEHLALSTSAVSQAVENLKSAWLVHCFGASETGCN